MPATGSAKDTRKYASSFNVQRTKETYAAHFGWQAAVLKCPDLRPLFKLVAWVLALFRNVYSGRCDPAMGTIAERAGVSVSTVQRAIKALEHLEFVAVVRRRGRHNCHQINFLSPPMADQKPDHRSDRFTDENRSARYKKPVLAKTDKHLEHAAPFGSGCEREAAPADAASPAVGRSPELPPAAGREESGPVKGSSEPQWSGGSSAKALPTGNAPLEHIDTPLPHANSPTVRPNGQADASGLIVGPTADAIFQELCKLWSKCPWIDPAIDRRAFDAALRRGVSSISILEGARIWAAAYSGPDGAPDAPHYLPGLAKWLAADKCLRKPPVRKRDVAAAFFKIGRIKDPASIDDNRARYQEILAQDSGEGEEIVKRFEKEVWPHIKRLWEPSARHIAWRLGIMARTIGSNDVESQSPLGYAREMLHRIRPMCASCYVLEDACQEFERDWKTLPKVPDMVNMIVKHFDRWEARWRPLRGDCDKKLSAKMP